MYAGINGYLDEIPTKDIIAYEHEMHEKLGTIDKSIIDSITSEKSLTAEIEASIKQFLQSSIQEFLSVTAQKNA